MTNDDAREFLSRLVALHEVLTSGTKSKPLSDAAQTLYFEALRDIPFELVCQALDQAVMRCTFFPKPVEIRNLIHGDPDLKIEEAWITWKEAARHIGSYRSWDCNDPVLAETLIAVFGGWPQACVAEYSPEMWAAKRKEFERVYRTLLERQLTGLRHLPGLIEQDNTTRGYLNAWIPTKELPS